ncbi:hypothetical protein NDU88_000588 [Pleurodeles waltl]|uniref:Uncharacterized protein n=1 Tax=Pleurodeles waltl TaxID=8319 RepID=A0AAV7UQF8_PLEWA|nr:hypothetical protein NDU88_000588 [Pleurodeles waltl]
MALVQIAGRKATVSPVTLPSRAAAARKNCSGAGARPARAPPDRERSSSAALISRPPCSLQSVRLKKYLDGGWRMEVVVNGEILI